MFLVILIYAIHMPKNQTLTDTFTLIALNACIHMKYLHQSVSIQLSQTNLAIKDTQALTNI